MSREYKRLLHAAKHADWGQVVANGGPPCFHLGSDGFFCLRAEKWAGHPISHNIVTLDALLECAVKAKSAASWIAFKDHAPPTTEPVVYARPKSDGRWYVGIAYWTVSAKWNPEAESQYAPGFTHWMPLPDPPIAA